jgi:hypothetical protein
LARYATQPKIPVRHIGGLLITAHSLAEKGDFSADKSTANTVHGLRMPMHTGMLEAQEFAQVVESINGVLKASTEALFR